MVEAKTDVKKIIRNYIRHLESDIKVQKVILFGSHARGQAHEWSDIDLAVISDDLKGLDQLQRIELLSPARRGCDVSLEPLGFTLDEYETASRLTFLGEIKRTGKVIYEAR
jgi:predicted nucleotidyltransferase